MTDVVSTVQQWQMACVLSSIGEQEREIQNAQVLIISSKSETYPNTNPDLLNLMDTTEIENAQNNN